LCVADAAHAAFYEFTIQGQVTAAAGFDVSVGDPFTIRYVANSEDRVPMPTAGSYAATNAVGTFPSTVITAMGFDSEVFVARPDVDGADRTAYRSDDLNYIFNVSFTFAPGTLTSDALPLALPLQDATSASLYLYDFGPFVTGNLTSYSSREVPEPQIPALLAVLGGLSLPRNRKLSLERARATAA
jgi:hypothetical protein